MKWVIAGMVSLFLMACTTPEKDTVCASYYPVIKSLTLKLEDGKLDEEDIALVDEHRVEWRMACERDAPVQEIRRHAEPIMRLDAER